MFNFEWQPIPEIVKRNYSITVGDKKLTFSKAMTDIIIEKGSYVKFAWDGDVLGVLPAEEGNKVTEVKRNGGVMQHAGAKAYLTNKVPNVRKIYFRFNAEGGFFYSVDFLDVNNLYIGEK